MRRLFAVTREEPLSAMVAIRALDGMKEGHDGSRAGLFMTDLVGDREPFKGYPIRTGMLKSLFILEKYCKKVDNGRKRLGQGAQCC